MNLLGQMLKRARAENWETVLEDSLLLPPDKQVEVNNMNAVLDKCLSKLTKREREIIEKRFGLALNDRLTLEAIGASFKLTRERN